MRSTQEIKGMIKRSKQSAKINISAELKRRNPYPVDIFLPLTRKQIQKYVLILIAHGLSSDAIHAHWGRIVWNNAAEECEKIIKERD